MRAADWCPLDIISSACYAMRMIKSFRNRDTEELANNRYVKQFDSIKDSARKKLEILNVSFFRRK